MERPPAPDATTPADPGGARAVPCPALCDRAVAVAAVGFVGALLGLASPALAGISGFETVAALTGNDSDAAKSVAVGCPEGKVAIARQARAFGSSSKVGLWVDAPTNATVAPAAPTGWQAAAREIVPTDDFWGVRVIALCADVPELVRVSVVDGPGHDDAKSATASCPVGLHPVGGGARISGAFDSPFLQGSRPVGGPTAGWEATAEELGGAANAPWSVQADVLCADVADVQIETAVSPIAPATFYDVDVVCPFPTLALGGGGRVVPTSGSQILGLVALSYWDVDLWKATASDVGGSGLDWQVEAAALCTSAFTLFVDGFESGSTSAWSP